MATCWLRTQSPFRKAVDRVEREPPEAPCLRGGRSRSSHLVRFLDAHPSPRPSPRRVVRNQKAQRENGLAHSDLLMEYKRLFVRHASHRGAFRDPAPGSGEGSGGGGGGGTGLLNVFATLLADPLSRTGARRTDADHVRVELVLHLVRNLLAVAPLGTFGSAERARDAAALHRDLVVVLRHEMFLDVLVVLGQEVGRRENQGYNLLLMEILGYLLKGQDPSDVARLAAAPPPPALTAPVASSSKGKSSKALAKTRVVRTTTSRAASASGANSLKAHLQSERNQLRLSATSRHSHFGGTLMVTRPDGGRSYVSATDYLARTSRPSSAGGSAGTAASSGIAAPARRKNRKAEVFVGSGRSSALHSRPGAGSDAVASRDAAGPAARRGALALDAFCRRFVADCYGPVTKSLKNEFRRESGRLEDGDRAAFFRIVWFFSQWWRVSREQEREAEGRTLKKPSEGRKPSAGEPGSAQNLIFTMDVFMFNLVLKSTDDFIEHKKPAALAQSVALYTEMIHMLHFMYESKDSTERTMALGLMDRLYYSADPLDRLPKLLSRWSPGTFGREYLCDLVECSHATWKLLDANAERCLKSLPTDGSELKRPKDAVERMTLTAAEFDRDHHFMRKFVSNQIIFMYTQLLSQYKSNAAHVNRHIAAYFIRLCKFTIKNSDLEAGTEYDDALGKNELAAKRATFEPILYNIGLLSVLDTILNDATIREDPDYKALLMFASSFVKRFARAAEVNPMLYVEALFKHPVPHRFCELSTNIYVTEELRMIAVRDLLLEDQKRYEQQADEAQENNEEHDKGAGVSENKAGGYDDEEEEELEFDDDNEGMDSDNIAPKKKRRRKPRKSRTTKSKYMMDSDQSSSGEEENGEEINTYGKTEEDEQCRESEPANMPPDSFSCQSPDSFDTDIQHVASSPSAGTDDTDGKVTSNLSVKKRIRKSQETGGNDDSEEEDFVAAPAKAKKRVIFDDDDEEDD
ncbi:hypothetical protein ACHAWF_018401 [Thalassiosira exigua]